MEAVELDKKKSVIMTVAIYGLLGYIFLNFAASGIKSVVTDKMMLSSFKYILKSSFVQMGYLAEKNDSEITDKHLKSNLLFNIIDSPMQGYTVEKTAANVADELNIRCFDEIYMETNYMEIMEKENQEVSEFADYVEAENSAKLDKNEETAKPVEETPKENEAKVEEQPKDTEVSANKIDTSALTYEFLMQNYYTVVSSTTLTPEDLNASELMAVDMKMQTKSDSPQILIYHTHGQEEFADSVQGDTSTTIIGVGDYLTKLLTEKYGYNVIHIKDSFDYINGVLDRHTAYDHAYEKIAEVLANNPSIEVVIDLHRDGVSETTHLVTEVNGKKTAKIMFFNGISRLNDIGEIGYLYNPYRKENLAFSLKMKLVAEEKFKGFTRRNYIQAYQYNLHLRPKSTLIEVGAQNNTVQEAKNAMEPLAEILNQVLTDG